MRTQKPTSSYDEWKRMKDTDTAHLAGVFDAIGTVTVSVVKDPDYRLNYTLRPILRLQRADEEDPLLGKLMAYCEEEGVRFSLSEKSHGADRDSTSVIWKVSDPESIERFLEPMMDYLVTNYFAAEALLLDVLPALEEGKHRSKEGFYELMELVDELREGSARGRDVKYDQDFFAEEWSISQ